MKKEVVNLLSKYHEKKVTIHDCYAWLSCLDWEELVELKDENLLDMVANLELISVEVVERLRPEKEFREESLKILENLKNTRKSKGK